MITLYQTGKAENRVEGYRRSFGDNSWYLSQEGSLAITHFQGTHAVPWPRSEASSDVLPATLGVHALTQHRGWGNRGTPQRRTETTAFQGVWSLVLWGPGGEPGEGKADLRTGVDGLRQRLTFRGLRVRWGRVGGTDFWVCALK